MAAHVANTAIFMRVPESRKMIALYLATDRLFASITFTTILFLCHYGFANNLRKILSFKFFIIFEKLGLCIFIAHAFVLKWQFYTLKTPIDWTFSFMVNLKFLFLLDFYIFFLQMYNFAVAFSLTMILAFIINFLVTQPFNNIFKCLLGAK